MSTDMRVKIYGCRGSIPVAGEEYTRYGGATSCVVVEAAGRQIVIDSGSGIIGYANDIASQADPHVFLFISHVHFDHVNGLPYFSPMYRPDATMEIWGPRNSRFGSIHDTIDAMLRPPFHPVPMFEMLAKKEFHDVGEADVVYFLKGQKRPIQLRPAHPDDRDKVPNPEDVEVSVHCMRGYNHPKSGVNLYKVVAGDKSVVYANDTEGYVHGDRRLIQFASGANVLLHDAMYTEEKYVSMPVPTQGYGHSTVEIATGLAHKAGVEHLVLIHHDPSSTDDYLDSVGELAKGLFQGAVMGRDGLVINV